MRDVIWTIIVIWLIYKVVDLFRGIQAKKTSVQHDHTNQSSQHQTRDNMTNPNLQSAMKKSADNEGEYVDFEEVK